MKRYYCTAIYDRAVAWLSGPFATPQDALNDLPRAKNAALDSSDPRAAFAAYGTARSEAPRTVRFPQNS